MPTTPYNKTTLPSEESTSSFGSIPMSDIEAHFNKLLRSTKELWSCINGADAGDDVNGTPLQSYLANGIVDRLERTEAGTVNTPTYWRIAYTVGVAGDRSIRLHTGSTSNYVQLKWVNSTSNFALSNQADTLQKLAIANATDSTHAVTKSQLDALETTVNAALATLSFPQVRQCVQSGPVDGSNLPAYLGTGSGLQPQILGGTTNVKLAFANGNNDYLETISSNQSFAALPASNTSYLYVTRTGAGALTYASTPSPIQYGQSFDTSKDALISFNGTNGATSITDAYSGTFTFGGNGVYSNAQSKWGTTSAYLDGTGDYIETTKFLNPTTAGFDIEWWVRPTAITSGQNLLGFCGVSTGLGFQLTLGTSGVLRWTISSNGTSWNLDGGTNGTTPLTANAWNHIKVSWDGTTYRAFLNGAVELTRASSTPFSATVRMRMGQNPISTGDNMQCYISDLRISWGYYRNAAAFTAPAAALTADAHWFDTQAYQMKVGSPASWVATNRIHVGRAVAGASTISSVEAMPYNGLTNSDWFSVSGSTTYVKNHYQGHTLYQTAAHLRSSAYPDFLQPVNYDSPNGTYVTHTGPRVVAMKTGTLSTSADFGDSFNEAGGDLNSVLNQARIVTRRLF